MYSLQHQIQFNIKISGNKCCPCKDGPLYLYDKTQFHMVKGIINAFDHMEFCLVINLTMASNWATSVCD